MTEGGSDSSAMASQLKPTNPLETFAKIFTALLALDEGDEK
jgi:hypothetical protein